MLWGGVTSISHPAAYLVGTADGGGSRWFQGSIGYFNVPDNTPSMVIGTLWRNDRYSTTFKLFDPSGALIVDTVCDATTSSGGVCEYPLSNPTPGFGNLNSHQSKQTYGFLECLPYCGMIPKLCWWSFHNLCLCLLAPQLVRRAAKDAGGGAATLSRCPNF